MKRPFRRILPLLLLMVFAAHSTAAPSSPRVIVTSEPGGFPLVADGRAATVIYDGEDHRVVAIAASCFVEDVERVTSVKPVLAHELPATRSPAVIIGSLDRSRLIQQLVKDRKLDVSDLTGQWESWKYALVDGNLVIVGSDRRGAAYGAFDLSRAIGVSPWNWWADVPPQRKKSLSVSLLGASLQRHGPPSVKYRGIFLNDEDWGLQPWAAKTFEPEYGDIGPKTYGRIFELLLRLRANYCWPAMHDCTKAFNADPRNKQVADDYAIVMGSSHCEQMLRNNVTEWPHDQHDKWDPVTNLPDIVKYWEQRVIENGKFESSWTVGMRGIHDGGMPGGGTIPEKRQRLEHIIELQRQLLARHVNPDPARVPQIFCPYKEVLDIYQAGMKLPDDVTIVWPDDNFGYIRQLPSDAERKRSGGHGVYYHLSYWGRPHDYLWLESTPPALIWHEMTKAYGCGAQRLWVVNVGDIKPIEAGTTLFLELAWDIDRYGPDVQQQFLRDFYTEQFGAAQGPAIAEVKNEYFRLAAIRKPEHLGFNTVYPNKPIRQSDFSHDPRNDEAAQRVEQYLTLARRAESIESQLPEDQRPAYFQLVGYPVSAAAAMNEKIIFAEKSRILASENSTTHADRARAAYDRIAQLTDRYNSLLNGKWRGMMHAGPRKLPVFDPPVVTPSPATTTNASRAKATSPTTVPVPAHTITFDAVRFTRLTSRQDTSWLPIPALGRRGAALVLRPSQAARTLRSPDEVQRLAPVAEYSFDLPAGAAGVEAIIEALPTQPITPAHALIVGISIDDAPPTIVTFEQSSDERNATWQQNVLRNAMFGRTKVTMPASPAPGRHTLKLFGADPSISIQHITLHVN